MRLTFDFDGNERRMAAYLKNMPGQGGNPAPVVADMPAVRAGEAIYVDACSACHNWGGTGVSRSIPALMVVSAVQQASAQNAHAVTGPAMPAPGGKLSDQQVANAVTFIRNAWGNAAASVSADDVRKVRADLTKWVK